MKTLNRTLSLALVFALVFSLMSFAFADTTTTTTTTTTATKLSDFTDASKLTYTEAADYLIAAGVVKGDTATTLNPQGDFTREQAAKLIAYACLGQTAADNLKAGSAPFTDVAADRWSAGYIAYCQKQGIINGLGDGTFGPTVKVTGYQVGKMLLCALGYGVNGEFTGAGWDLEVAKLALAKDIFKNNTAGASNVAANREEAFLYTFNALTNAMIVKYNESLNVYYSGTNPFENNQTFENKYTIGYQRFKMIAKAGTSTYAEATHYWTVDGKKVTGTYPDDPIAKLATSADGTPYANLTTKGETGYIGYTANKTVGYYVNGDASTVDAVTADAKVRGNVINFYDTDKDGKYDVVEALVYSIVKLTAAPTIVTSGSTTVVTMGDLSQNGKTLSKITSDNITGDYASLKKDDYVLFYCNRKGSDWTIAKAESVTGQLFGYNDAASILGLNINGTNYFYTGITTKPMDYTDITATKGLAGTTFYFDKGKGVIAAVASTDIIAASNVVYVLGNDSKFGTVTAKLLKSDGTTVVKTVSKVVSTGNVTQTATQALVPLYTFFTFNENTDGSYTLKAIPAGRTIKNATNYGDAKQTVFKKGTANFFFDGVASGTQTTTLGTKGTGSTVFVLEGDTDGTRGSYKSYTGISNIPTVTTYDYNKSGAYQPAADVDGNDTVDTDGPIAKVLNDKDGYAIMAVALRGSLDNSVSAYDYAFVGLPASTVTKNTNSNEEYHTYQLATVNGELKSFNSTIGLSLTEGYLYAITSYDNGKADAVLTDPTKIAQSRLYNDLAMWAKDDVKEVTTTKFDVKANTVTYKDVKANTERSFTVASDVKVFYYDLTNAAAKKVTLEKQSGIDVLQTLPATSTYTLEGLRVSDKDNTINELYVVIKPIGSSSGSTVTPKIWAAAAGTTYSVDYYAQDAAWVNDKNANALKAVEADLTVKGWSIVSDNRNTGKDGYDIKVAKTVGGTSVTETYTLTDANVKEVFSTGTTKVDVSGNGYNSSMFTVTAGNPYAHDNDVVTYTVKFTGTTDTNDTATITPSNANADTAVTGSITSSNMTKDKTFTCSMAVNAKDMGETTITIAVTVS